MLLVFDKSDTLLAILENTNTACNYMDAVSAEKLTAEWRFSFSIVGNHSDAQYLAEGNSVGFFDLDNNFQLFEIKQVEDVDNGEITKYVDCEHAFYEILDDPIEDKRPTIATASSALTDALSSSRWVPGTVDNLGTNSIRFWYTTAMSCVLDVANRWKGELKPRLTIAGKQITGRYIDLVAQRGSVTGKQFTITKDIKTIERKVDFTGVCTALYGRGKGQETDSGGYGSRLDFKDVGWASGAGDPADKPNGQPWVGDPTALAQYGRAGGTRHRFGWFTDDQETSPNVLLYNTWVELQKRKTPRITYTVDAITLETLTGYAHEAVRLGDTVTVIDNNFSPALVVTARVIELQRNLLQPEETKVILGNFKPDLSNDGVIQQNINRTVSDNSGVWDGATALQRSVVDPTRFELRNELRATNGFVQITPTDGIIIYDTPDPTTATKALKLGGGIFAIANSKTSGQWNWQTFGNGDGFVADRIISGIMLADRIRGGTLTVGGLNNTYGIQEFHDGNDDIAGSLKVNPTTGALDATFGKIAASNAVLIQPTTQTSLFVDPVNGNDSNDGSAFYNVKTITRALNLAQKYIKNLVTIYCLTGTYNEQVFINGFQGEGKLELSLGTNTINGCIQAFNCTCELWIHGQNSTSMAIVNAVNSSAVPLYGIGCTRMTVNYLKVKANQLVGYPARVHFGNYYLRDCSFTDGNYASLLATMALVFVQDVKGKSTTYGVMAQDGTCMNVYGMCPTTSTGSNIYNEGGGKVLGQYGAPTADDYTGTVPPVRQTTQWSATLTGTWRYDYSYWRTDNAYVYQGAWSNGNMCGLWWVNNSSLRSTLSGKTILSARLYLERMSSGGSSSAQNIHLRSFTNTGTSGSPGFVGDYGYIGAWAWGEGKWVDLPVSAVSALVGGTANALGLYDGASGYSIFYTNVIMEVTYQ